MAYKIKQKPVVTNDRIVTGIESLTGDLFFNGPQHGNQIQLPPTSWTVNCSLGNYFIVDVRETGTFKFSTPPAVNSYGFILEVHHYSGVIGWPSFVHWPGELAPMLELRRTHLFVFTKDSRYEWRGGSHVNYRVLNGATVT